MKQLRESLYMEELPIVRSQSDLMEIPTKDHPKVEDGSIAAIFLSIVFVAAIIILVV